MIKKVLHIIAILTTLLATINADGQFNVNINPPANLDQYSINHYYWQNSSCIVYDAESNEILENGNKAVGSYALYVKCYNKNEQTNPQFLFATNANVNYVITDGNITDVNVTVYPTETKTVNVTITDIELNGNYNIHLRDGSTDTGVEISSNNTDSNFTITTTDLQCPISIYTEDNVPVVNLDAHGATLSFTMGRTFTFSTISVEQGSNVHISMAYDEVILSEEGLPSITTDKIQNIHISGLEQSKYRIEITEYDTGASINGLGIKIDGTEYDGSEVDLEGNIQVEITWPDDVPAKRRFKLIKITENM